MTTIKRGLKYKDIPTLNEPSLKTVNEKFNKWITAYDGFVKGTINYWTGTSGSGKTTLLTMIANSIPDHLTAVYSREMILAQLKHQLGPVVNHDNVEFIGVDQQPNFNSFMDYLWDLKPSLTIVDSLEVTAKLDFKDQSLESACEEITLRLKDWAEQTGGVVVLIGHVNKDNSFAGSNTIMHLVDAHIEMIYNKKTRIATLGFGEKNRKGDKTNLLYYEFISQGNIELFTPAEYEEKLMLATKPAPFLDAIENIIKTYEKLAKGHVNEQAFREELKTKKTQIRKSVGDRENSFMGDYVAWLSNLLQKYEII